MIRARFLAAFLAAACLPGCAGTLEKLSSPADREAIAARRAKRESLQKEEQDRQKREADMQARLDAAAREEDERRAAAAAAAEARWQRCRDAAEPLRNEPLSFKVARADADDAWGRAQVFVSKHSTMRIATATEFIIETYAPTNGIGWIIRRSPAGADMAFEVATVADPPGILHEHGRVLGIVGAHYIRTGKTVPECD